MARASLIDDTEFAAPAQAGKAKKTGGGGGGGMPPAQVIKLVVAVVCLLGAGLLIAWSNGMFDRPPKVDPQQAAQEQAEFERQQREIEPLLKRPDAVESGA